MRFPWLARRQMTLLMGALAFLGCCVVYYALSHAAGCAADIKGGAWGDPARARELEYLSLLPGLGALALATAAPLNYLHKSVAVRATVAVLSFVAVGSALLVGGIGAEFNASHTCSA